MRKWTKKPPQGTAIDWSNPLAKRLLLAIPMLGSNEFQDYGPLKYSVQNNGASPAITSQGAALFFDGSAGTNLSVPNFVIPQNGVSIVTGITPTTDGTRRRWMGADTNWECTFESNNNILTQVYASIGSETSSFALANVYLQMAIGCKAEVGDASAFYINGEGDYWDTGTSDNAAVPSSATLEIGESPAGSNPLTGYIHYFFLFDSKLTPKELKSLSADPWQIFKGPRNFALADPLPDTRVLNVASATQSDPLIAVVADGTATAVSTRAVTHGFTLVPGDVLVAAVHWNGAGTLSSNGGVFTEDFEESNPTPSGSVQAIYSRIVDGTEGATFTWDTTAASDVDIVITQFRGIDRNAWTVVPSTAQRVFDEPVTELALSDLTTSIPSIGLIITFGDHGTDAVPGYTDGYKSAVWSTVGESVGIAYKVYDTPIKTSGLVTFGTSNDWVCHHVALGQKRYPAHVDVKMPIEYEELTFDSTKEERLFMIPQRARRQPK